MNWSFEYKDAISPVSELPVKRLNILLTIVVYTGNPYTWKDGLYWNEAHKLSCKKKIWQSLSVI